MAKLARPLRLTVPEKQNDVLEMTGATASMDLSKEGEGTMGVLSEAMNSACYL